MSQITMTIIDPSGAIHGRPHGSFADLAVAALSAEPETIEELEAALARFITPGEREHLATWSGGACDEPFDAGICIVDLAARLVVLRSRYSSPGPKGEVQYRDNQSDTEIWVPYHLSDDWAFSQNLEAWEGLAEKRRRQRLAAPPLDARAVLYGQLCEFVVEQCLAARGDRPAAGAWTPPEGWSVGALPERAARHEKPTAEDAVAEIHARWLMTPREDLRGRSPREVLLSKKSPIDWDLQDRCCQWTMVGACPPGLSRQSAAFRFGGFGTHENVLYYELVRHLIWECWGRVVEPDPGDAPGRLAKADEVRRLRQIQEEWLGAPQLEDLSGWPPEQVIERERMRLPMAVSGEEAVVDDDCPLCQMMAEQMGPMFWHLDGCNMDDDFPFSFHGTRQEWEKERREWEEIGRRVEEEWKHQQAGSTEDDTPRDDGAESSSVWQRSISNTEARNEAPSITLFGIGSHVAELGVDLKASPDTAPFQRSLNRHFGNLLAAIRDSSPALVEPVVQRFCEELHSVTEARPGLAEKCADLERQLNGLAARLSAEGEPEDDLPF